MISERKTAHLGLRFAIFAVFAIGLLFVDANSIAFQTVRSVLFSVAKPLVEAAEFPADVQVALRYALYDRDLIMQRNREVSEENVRLRHRIIQLESSEQHAKWLGSLLHAREQVDYPVLQASLKLIELTPTNQRVVIDRGTDDGVFVGQAVLDFRGILGQVVEVTGTESAVSLITHSNHSIPVRVRRTGLLAIANGLGGSQVMSIPYIAGNPDMQVGDILVTSGLGGRFPADYPVAELVEVKFDRNEPFAEIKAKPLATIDYGYDVLLVMKPETDDPNLNSIVSMNEVDS